jgi:hypothetical protein
MHFTKRITLSTILLTLVTDRLSSSGYYTYYRVWKFQQLYILSAKFFYVSHTILTKNKSDYYSKKHQSLDFFAEGIFFLRGWV